jgi:hypothetical protein
MLAYRDLTRLNKILDGAPLWHRRGEQLPARVCREDQDERAWRMMTMTPLTIGTIFGGISSSLALSR